MFVVLGAGGAMGDELVKQLLAGKLPFRLVSRHAHAHQGAAEVMHLDLTDKDQAALAVKGASVAFLLVGLEYNRKVWEVAWPRIMANVIEACKRNGTRLVFFDNVYMYGRVKGPMTEVTRYEPCSRKGEIRAGIAEQLKTEWNSGNLTAMIARSADFYGSYAVNGIPNALVFGPLSAGKSAMCLVDDSQPHSYTYTPDAALALVLLVESEAAWNQTWHLPTAANPPTGKQFIEQAAEALKVKPKYRVLSRPKIRMVGWFNPLVREVYEMLYQNDSPYVFDSSKFTGVFGHSATPYEEGIRATAATYRE
ncbi:MAG TPA: NAD-dependent epimerase/dehydratase family protein [Acidobacteriaceae bacterium]|nr:NAD-dependent epimerase/dehydratase family protein [Acidobacteriaceae bacterium]